MAVSRPVRSLTSTDPALIPLGGHQGKPPFILSRPVFIIGSRSSARIHLVSSTVSKAHALLVRSGGGVYIRDLASRNKVLINGQPKKDVDLQTGDEIQIGRFIFRFRGGGGGIELPTPAEPAELFVDGQPLALPIDQRVLLIGRRHVCDIPLLEESVSTAHAVIFEIDGQRFIRDLGSRTGTFVNGVSTHQHQLSPGDRIRIGQTNLVYQRPGAQVTSEAAVDDPLGLDLATPAIADVNLLGPSIAPPDIVTETAVAERWADVPTLAPAIDETVPPPGWTVAKAESQVPASAKSEDEAFEILDELPEHEEALVDLSPAPTAEIAQPAELEPTAPAAEIAPETFNPPLETDELAFNDAELLQLPAVIEEQVVELPRIADQPGRLSESDAAEIEPVSIVEPPVVESLAAEHSEIEQPIEAPAEASLPTVEADAPTPVEELLETPAPIDEIVQPAEADIESIIEAELAGPAQPFVDPPLALDELDRLAASEAIEQLPTVEGDTPDPAEAALETPPALDEILAPAEPTAPVDEQSLPPRDAAISETPAEVKPPPMVEVREDDIPPEVEPPRKGRGKKPPKIKKLPASKKPPARRPPGQALPVVEVLPDDAATLEPLDSTLIEPESVQAAEEFAPLETLPLEPGLELNEAAPKPQLPEPIEHRPIMELGIEAPVPATPASESLDGLLDLIDPSHPDEVDITPIVESDGVTEALEAPLLEPEVEEFLPAQAELNLPGEKSAEVSPLSDSVPNAEDSVIDTMSAEPSDLMLEAPTSDDLDALADLLVETEPFSAADLLASDDADTLLPGAADQEVKTPDATVVPEGKPRVKWTANHDNSLGGQPLTLPPADPVSDLAASMSTEPPPTEHRDEPEPPKSNGVMHIPPGKSVGGAPNMIIPPRPKRRQVFSSESDQPFEAPKNGEEQHGKQLVNGFEALADSPLREMDVFSQMSPPAEDTDDLIDADLPDEADEPAHRPRGTIAGMFDETPEPEARRSRVTPQMPELGGAPQMPRTELTEVQARAIRKRSLIRISSLLATMIVLIGASAALIYNFVGVGTNVDAWLRFKNLSSLKQIDSVKFKSDQLKLLKEEPTRKLARQKLNEADPEVASGFFDDQLDYVKQADRAAFSDRDPELLMVHLEGHDEASDGPRALAMIQALYARDAALRDDSSSQREGLDKLKESINDSQLQLNNLNNAIANLKLKNENAPAAQQVQTLQAEVDKLDAAWATAVSAVKSAEADLARIKAGMSGDSNDAQAEASSKDAPPTVGGDDSQIKELQSKLSDAKSKVAAEKQQTDQATAAARKALDDTLGGFQKQVADAQGMAGNNPVLAAYIQSAQRLLETTKKLTDELIHSEEKQYGELTNLKDRLNEKMETRRQEMWQSDKELEDLSEQQAILERKYNTALGSGLQKEADDLKVQIDLTKNMIKARQDLLPGDAFYADAISQLQKIIDSSKKHIDDNRAQTEELLTTLQQGFTSSDTVAQLPEEQKQLAAALTQRLNDINAARKQYNDAIAQTAGESQDASKAQLVSIEASIDARQKQIADEKVKALQGQQRKDRLTEITNRETQLKQLNDAETAARQDFFNAQHKLRDAQANLDQARTNSDELDALTRQKTAAQADLESKLAQVDLKQRQAAAVIDPVAPTRNDMIVRRGDDRRPLLALSAAGALLLIFSALVLWSVHQASAQLHPHVQMTEISPALLAPVEAKPIEAKSQSAEEEQTEPAPVL